jgi:hypothetical protein
MVFSRINLNLKKCTFMIFSRLILRFIVSDEGKNTKPLKGSGNNEYAITYKTITYLGL